MKVPRILITSGEPAGIGPDIIVQLAQDSWPAELIVLGDPDLLLARAKQLKLPLNLKPFDPNALAETLPASCLKILPLPLSVPCESGKLNKENAAYVLRQLETAAQAAMKQEVAAIVTAPVHKGVLNEAGFAFQGHTEFFANYAGVAGKVVMLFVIKRNQRESLKVALATTHLPLAKVSQAITAERLETVLTSLRQGLEKRFKLEKPAIFVCGLNPHAGESGYLGREEIEVITPTLDKLRGQGFNLLGPLSADSLFTEQYLEKADAILAMYHDQALPVVKYMSFGKAVNVSLGLPFIRTSVDHGTALGLAGTGKADAGSLRAAVELAVEMGG